MHGFFSEFERIFSFKLREKDLSFILDIASGMPEGIFVDEARLRQIVFNLIGNAIKFTSEGHIRLGIRADNLSLPNPFGRPNELLADLVIDIEDTGMGISNEKQATIFDPFVQEQNFNKFGGTGLGLSICRRLAGLMNGTISLRSEPGIGSTFTVSLPGTVCLTEYDVPHNELTVNASDVIFASGLVLIVDDVPHNRALLIDALKGTSLDTCEADNGETGYEMARTRLPKLVITDIRMPQLDGFGLIEKIKNDPVTKDIPVLAYSASVLKGQKERIIKSRFDGLLVKPVRMSDLYVALMKYLPYSLADKPQPVAAVVPGLESEEPADVPELVDILNIELNGAWNAFKVRQPINEVRSFGSRLYELGKRHGSATLMKYGEELKTKAENFNIEGILGMIQDFPDLVAGISRHLPGEAGEK